MQKSNIDLIEPNQMQKPNLELIGPNQIQRINPVVFRTL